MLRVKEWKCGQCVETRKGISSVEPPLGSWPMGGLINPTIHYQLQDPGEDIECLDVEEFRVSLFQGIDCGLAV